MCTRLCQEGGGGIKSLQCGAIVAYCWPSCLTIGGIARGLGRYVYMAQEGHPGVRPNYNTTEPHEAYSVPR